MATYENLNLPRLADRALQGFVKGLLPLRLFSSSFSPEELGRHRGNTVLVPLVGTLTATTFGGTYAVCGGSKSVITVTINRHKVVHLGQQDLDALNNSESDLDSYGFQAGKALATEVVRDVLTLVTTANFGFATSTAGANLDVVHLRKAKLNLDTLDCPQEDRFALVSTLGMDALLAVTNFVQAQMFYDNTVLREGRVMRALGFDFHTLNGLFTPASNSINAFIGHAQAIAIAMRYLRPQKPEAYELAEAFSDPETGATFGIRKFYDEARGEDFVAFEANYGYSVGITRAGQIIGLNV